MGVPNIFANASATIPLSQLDANFAYVTNTAPTVQTFTSGSGTYTTPNGASWLEVYMVGGGGGGGAGVSAVAATKGGDTTFGSSLLTAAGGAKGIDYNGTPTPSGGAPTINSPAINVGSLNGSPGGSGGIYQIGGAGGGYGGGGSLFGAGGAVAATNTGGGGGGGGTNTSANPGGFGGGSGAIVWAIIKSPSATYSYTVGAGGTGASGSGSSFNGGNGAAGIIFVKEYYAG